MTADKKNRMIAEWMGLKVVHGKVIKSRNNRYRYQCLCGVKFTYLDRLEEHLFFDIDIPDYCSSLDLIHEVEERLIEKGLYWDYHYLLIDLPKDTISGHESADQKATAICEVING